MEDIWIMDPPWGVWDFIWFATAGRGKLVWWRGWRRESTLDDVK